MKTYFLILFCFIATTLKANDSSVSFDSLVYQRGPNTFVIWGNGKYQVYKNTVNKMVKEGSLADSTLFQLNETILSLPKFGEVQMENSDRYPSQDFTVYRDHSSFKISGNTLYPEPYIRLQQVYSRITHEMLTNIVYTNEGYINLDGRHVLCWYIHHKRTLEEMHDNYRSWPDKSELVFYVIPQNKKYLKCSYDYILYLPEPPKYFDMETGLRIPNPEKPTIVDTQDAIFVKELLKNINKYTCR